MWCSSGPLREQARSHKGFINTEDPVWERACSRRGPHRHYIITLASRSWAIRSTLNPNSPNT
ncbi:hypothetical protein C0J56_22235 [Pseudomonas fluorescens]|nr:hypothetical protein C0J56_22235 [Pseudomonas fluorescens]